MQPQQPYSPQGNQPPHNPQPGSPWANEPGQSAQPNGGYDSPTGQPYPVQPGQLYAPTQQPGMMPPAQPQNRQYSSPQSNQQQSAPGQYDFIMRGQPKKQGNLFPGGHPTGKSLGILIGAFVGLIIIGYMVASLMTGAGDDSAQLRTIALEQQKLITLTNTDSSGQAHDLSNPVIGNFAATTNASLASSQKQILAYLTAQHHTIDSKTLAAAVDTSDQSQLSNAKQANHYDNVYSQILKQHLAAYQNILRSDFKLVSGDQAKQLLKDAFTQTTILLAKDEQ